MAFSSAFSSAASARRAPGQVYPPAVLALLAVVACMSPSLLGDGDVWTHVAAGRWMLEHGSVLRSDPFTATMAGQPWQAHEWLSEILLALSFRVAGPTGVMILAACAAGLAFGNLACDVNRVGGWWSAMVLTGAALILAVPSLLARPHLLALPVVEGWTAGLLTAREDGRAPSPWLLAAMTLWANLHGGFAFGIALAVAFAADAAIRQQKEAGRWALFVAGCVAAAALTPQGPSGLLFPWRLLQLDSLRLITEWKPLDLQTHLTEDAVFAGLLVLLATGRLRLDWLRSVLLAVLVIMALAHGRHGILFGMVGALLLARPFGQAFLQSERRSVGGVICGAGIIVLLGWRLACPVPWTDTSTSPVSAVSGLQPGAAVLNSYSFGGYLTLFGLRPFIDGRAELFRDQFIADYFALSTARPEDLNRRLREDGITVAVLAPEDALTERLGELPGWRRVHRDGVAIVFQRE